MISNRIVLLSKLGIIKTAFWGMMLAVLTTGCHDRSNQSNQTITTVEEDTVSLVTPDSLTSEMSEEAERGVVLNQVKNIYRLLRAEYMIRGGSYENELFDKVFCSKSWNNLLMTVRYKEEQTGTLFFEIDHWAMTRYSGTLPSFDEFEVEYVDLLSPVKRASVAFTVYEDDTYTPARVDLVYEDGRWVIDNFHNLKYMIDVRSAMWNYVAHPYII